MDFTSRQFQRLLFLSAVLVFYSAVAVAANPPNSPQQIWYQLSMTSANSRSRRDVTDGDSGESPQCLQVDECASNTAGSFENAMIDFRIREVYEESLSLCSNPPVQDCWDNGCDDLMARREINFVGRIAAEVCENQDAFRAASACDQGALGDTFNTCGLQAHTQVMRHTKNFNPVAFANYYLMCGYDVIDSIPLPCQDEDKTFLKSFFEFVILSNLDKIDM